MRGAAFQRWVDRGSSGVDAVTAVQALRRSHVSDPGHPGVHGGDERAVRPGIFRCTGDVVIGPEEQAMTGGLPGDPTAAQAAARMIRVDHAGEYGATRI